MTDPTALPPIRRQIVVPTDPVDAFRLWTDDLATWWPFDGHSVFGTGGSVAFADGLLVETSADGERSSWGEVLDWVPGEALRMTWHPGQPDAPAERSTEVAISFTAIDHADVPGPHTLVSLEHRGWERRPDAATARREYEGGWVGVVARFAEAAADKDEVWLVLTHTPGPNGPTEGSFREHPDFREHVAFLQRLHARGVLVGAGPITGVDEPPGAVGQAILRVPAAEVDAYLELARTDDQSVVRGFFTVEPKRWLVALR